LNTLALRWFLNKTTLVDRLIADWYAVACGCAIGATRSLEFFA
jgi:hypothetical protein